MRCYLPASLALNMNQLHLLLNSFCTWDVEILKIPDVGIILEQNKQIEETIKLLILRDYRPSHPNKDYVHFINEKRDIYTDVMSNPKANEQ